MADEIEKKYLIFENGEDHSTEGLNEVFPSIEGLKEVVLANGKSIRQGYVPLEEGLNLAEELSLGYEFAPTEARLRDKAGKLFFTLKGKGGLTRGEAESTIDEKVFKEYWSSTEGNRVEKVRLSVPYQGHELEVDVYTDRDLIVAEVEVDSVEEAERLTPVGKDITEDSSYKNKNLAK